MLYNCNRFFKSINSRRIFLCVLSSVLLSSCRDHQERVVTKFPQQVSLEANSIDGTDKYQDILSVTMVADKYVCRSKGEFFYYVFDSQFQLISRIARRGHGNKEFIAPFFSGQYLQEKGREYIYLLERPQRTLYKVNIHDAMDVVPVFRFPIGKKIEPRYIFSVANKFVGANDLDDCKIFVYDRQCGECVFKEQTYTSEKRKSHELFESIASYSPSNEKLAVAFFNLPQIDIRNSNGDILNTIFIDKKLPLKEDMSDKLYFSCVCSTDKYIYALYNGYDDLEKQGKSAVLVFDWNANPIVKYIIDASSYITVDIKKKRLVTIDEKASNSRLLSYPISNENL